MSPRSIREWESSALSRTISMREVSSITPEECAALEGELQDILGSIEQQISQANTQGVRSQSWLHAVTRKRTVAHAFLAAIDRRLEYVRRDLERERVKRRIFHQLLIAAYGWEAIHRLRQQAEAAADAAAAADEQGG